MQRIAPAISLVLTLTSAGCEYTRFTGSGVSKTETRDVEIFDRITFYGAGTIEVTIGQPQSVTLTTDDNVLPLIDTQVTDGKLVIKPTRSHIRQKVGLVVRVTVAELSALAINGAASSRITGVDNESLNLTLSGAGKITAQGKTHSLQLVISGAGDADTVALQAKDVEVTVSGVGDAAVNATEKLSVSISGAGSVVYTGEPEVTKSIAGAGSVRHKS